MRDDEACHVRNWSRKQYPLSLERQESKKLLNQLNIFILYLILRPSVAKAVTKCRNHHWFRTNSIPQPIWLLPPSNQRATQRHINPGSPPKYSGRKTDLRADLLMVSSQACLSQFYKMRSAYNISSKLCNDAKKVKAYCRELVFSRVKWIICRY